MKKVMDFLRKLINNNTFLIVISLLIACTLWFYVNGYYNPDDTDTIYDVPVSINFEGSIPAQNGLTILESENASVDITVTGPRVYLATLRRDSIAVAVDLDKVTAAGSYSLPINIVIPNSDKISISDQSIYSVNVEFDKQATKEVPVEVVTKGELKADYMLDTITVSPSVINLVGPSKLLDNIDNIPVEINVSALTATQTIKSEVVIKDKNGDEIENSNITKDFDTVAVNIPVFKVKEVPVTVALVNSSGGSDEAIFKTEITPSTIRVAANETDLQEYNQLILGTIDTSQYDGNTVVNFDIVSPSGIRLIDDVEKVSVKLSLDTYHTTTFAIPTVEVEFSNVPEGILPSITTGSISVKLRGVPANIDSLTADDIKANIDMNSVTATNGTVALPVTFTIKDQSNVGVIGKYTLNVNLNKS